MITEEWRDFPGCENELEISNLGRVRRKSRIGCYNNVIPAKILKLQGNVLHTSINCKHLALKVKESVAKAFIPIPDDMRNDNVVVVTIGNRFDFSVKNLKYVTLNEYHKTEAKNKKSPIDKKIKRSPEAIIQMRLDGSFVRRYRDIDEVLEVHPLWNKVELLIGLSDFMPDAYGYKWRYEVDI